MLSNPEIRDFIGIKDTKIGVFTIGYPNVSFYRTAPPLAKQIERLEK